MPSRALKALIIMTGLASAAACSGGGASNAAGPSATSAATINIVGQNATQAFSPNPASFGGQAVAFKNNDSVAHRIVLNDGSIDFGDVAPGGTSRAATMPAAGTNFHCSIHPGMIGSITAATGGAPPPCEGLYCSGY